MLRERDSPGCRAEGTACVGRGLRVPWPCTNAHPAALRAGLLSPHAKLVFLPVPALSPLSALRGTGSLRLQDGAPTHPGTARHGTPRWVPTRAPRVLPNRAGTTSFSSFPVHRALLGAFLAMPEGCRVSRQPQGPGVSVAPNNGVRMWAPPSAQLPAMPALTGAPAMPPCALGATSSPEVAVGGGGAGSARAGRWHGGARARGGCLAPTEAAAASRPRAGKAPLRRWLGPGNICSMRSWCAETARSPRLRLREVTRPRGHRGEVAAGDGPGAPSLGSLCPPPSPARGFAGLGTRGDPSVGRSPSVGRVPGVPGRSLRRPRAPRGCPRCPLRPRCPSPQDVLSQ